MLKRELFFKHVCRQERWEEVTVSYLGKGKLIRTVWCWFRRNDDKQKVIAEIENLGYSKRSFRWYLVQQGDNSCSLTYMCKVLTVEANDSNEAALQ